MSKHEETIRRYQNDPIFHKLVDVLVDILERGTMDRYAIMDALQVAELIQCQRAPSNGSAGAAQIRDHEIY